MAIWKPMGSAPRNGEKILVSDGADVFTVRWMNIGGGIAPDNYQWVEYVESSSGFNHYETIDAPWGWMDLPTPPTEAM